jgi:zinc protease
MVAKDIATSFIFGADHPYVKRIQKRLAVLDSLSASDLHAQFQKSCTQSNLRIAVCGNTSEAEIKPLLEGIVASLPKGELRKQEADGDLLNMGKTLLEEMDIPQAVIVMAHPGLPRSDPDFYAAYLLVSGLANGNLESRLFNEIREKRGLAYNIDMGLFTSALKYGMMGATATKTESVKEVISLIRSVFKKTMEEGLTEEELDLHKKQTIGSYPMSFSETTTIVRVLLSYQCEGFPKTYLNERNDYFRKVTLDDIKRVAKRILDPELLTFVIVGKKN